MSETENGRHGKSDQERAADLFATPSGDFRFDDREKIMAAAREREDRGMTWDEVLRDFHNPENKHWGFAVFPPGHPETKRKLTEEEVRSKDVRGFLWTALQSLVIIKGIILFFGLNYAMEREEFFGGREKAFYAWGLGITVFISFGGLLLFAIRKSSGRHWN